MDNKVIEITADSLDEARQQAKSNIPEGLSLLSEDVLSDGKPRTINGIGEKPEDALASARAKVPSGAVVVEKKQLLAAGNKTIVVQAFDEDGVKSQAKRTLTDGASVKAITLAAKGRRGFLGIGRTPNNYEVHIHQQTVVQLTFKEKARIRATIGPKPKCQRCGKAADRLIPMQLQAPGTAPRNLDVCSDCFADAARMASQVRFQY